MATDLYGVGATLLFLLTRRSPAELPVNGLRPDFRRQVNLSEGLADWLEKLLEPELEERFASAEAALAALVETTKAKEFIVEGSKRDTVKQRKLSKLATQFRSRVNNGETIRVSANLPARPGARLTL